MSGIGPLPRKLRQQVDVQDAEAPVEERESQQGADDLRRADRSRDGVGRLEDAVDDPGLAADLGHDPAELSGEVGNGKRKEHDLQEEGVILEVRFPREPDAD